MHGAKQLGFRARAAYYGEDRLRIVARDAAPAKDFQFSAVEQRRRASTISAVISRADMSRTLRRRPS